MVKRGNPKDEDYIYLKAGKYVDTKVNLSNVYSIPECKRCMIQFKSIIQHIIIGNSIKSQNSEHHRLIEIRGNTATFSIINQNSFPN